MLTQAGLSSKSLDLGLSLSYPEAEPGALYFVIKKSKVRNRVDRVAEYSTYSPKGGTTKAVVSSDFDKTPTTKDVVSSKSHY